MPSTKGKARQRQLARAKEQRQIARRAAAERRRRQWLAGLGIGALVVALFGILMWMGVIDFSSDEQPASPEPSTSSSTPVDPSASADPSASTED